MQFDKLKNNRILPYFAILPLISCWIWNMFMYYGSRMVNGGLKHYDMTTAFDLATPVIPETIIIYFGCFGTWVIYYILCGRVDEKYTAKFVTFDILSRTICGIFFVLLPTCNIRPEIVGNGFFEKALLHLYATDAADNLFPSIHCLVSWNCFIGIRGLSVYKKRYKVLACVIAILVFLSTLYTKQHVVADVYSAVIVSELAWFVVNHTNFYLKVWKFFHALSNRVFRVNS